MAGFSKTDGPGPDEDIIVIHLGAHIVRIGI